MATSHRLPTAFRRTRTPYDLQVPAVVLVIVYAVLLIAVPSQLIFAPLGAPGTPANLWAIGALVWWCCMTLGGRNPVQGFTGLRIAALLLSAAVLAAYANGMRSGWYAPPTIRQATDESWTRVPQSVEAVTTAMISAADRGLLSCAGWLGILLVCAEGFRSWRDLELLVTWLSGLGAALGMLGLVQFFTGYDIAALFTIPGLTANADFGTVLGRSVLNRVSGTAVHPIEFGVVLAGLFPLALHRTIYRWGVRGAALPTVLIGVGAFLSVSRSAVLAMAIGGVVLFLGWPRAWRVRALWVAPVALVGMRVAIPGLVGTIRSLFTNFFGDPSVTGRTADYGIVLHLYSDHEWFGRGLFTFVPRYYRILDNQYLMILVELGAVGLAASLLLLLTAVLTAGSARRHSTSARSRHLSLALTASVLSGALAMGTFDAWGFPMAAGCSFMLIGCACSTRQLMLRENNADLPAHDLPKEVARAGAR